MTRSTSSSARAAHRHSPYPAPASVDSTSDYSPEPDSLQPPTTATKRRARNGVSPEERRMARAERNRLAAQSSRDRKKTQFSDLSARVAELEEENRVLRSGALSSPNPQSLSNASQENAALRLRVQQLEQAWQHMSRLLGSLPLTHPITPLPSSSLSNLRPPTFDLPLSPAPTSTSGPESLDELLSSEPTCESAAGGLFKERLSPQITTGSETWSAGTMYPSITANDIKTVDTNASLLLTTSVPSNDFDGLVSSTTLDEGSLEMERLLGLLPESVVPVDHTLPLDDEWSWLMNQGVF